MNVLQFPENEKISSLPHGSVVKFGIDPTAVRLHLGHVVPLLLCKQLKEQGHQIKIVIGTFTAQIGDPTGKEKTRPIIPREQTIKNAQNIIVFIKKFLGDVEILFNHEWLENFPTSKLLNLLGKFTWAQLSARENFQLRLEKNESISISELIMPTLQGLDSVQLNAKIEIGGVDQLFNFKITRDVQNIFGQIPQICLMTQIIKGTDGRKMSKSLDNCIFVDDAPIDVFGKTMRISDHLMAEWWEIFMTGEMVTEINPMQNKKKLAFTITFLLHSFEDAIKAREYFEQVIQNKNVPVEEQIVKMRVSKLIDCVMKARNISKTEVRKLLKGNGVSIDGVVVNDDMELNADMLVKIGKRQFIKIQ